MGDVVDIDEFKSAEIVRMKAEQQRLARLSALEHPPATDVAWTAWKTAEPFREVLLYSQTWITARIKAALLLKCAPEEITVERAR